jgi:enoyl-CoA hydratase/carnithine racemase
VVTLLAACGGADNDTQIVRGTGFTFDAPATWKLVRTPRAIGAQGDAVELVQVTRLPLARRYSPELFERVVPELDAAARAVATEVGAKVEPRTVEVLGERVRQYDLTFDGKLEQLTFYLRGKANYQLLCRRDVDGDDEPCDTLVRSFRLS